MTKMCMEDKNLSQVFYLEGDWYEVPGSVVLRGTQGRKGTLTKQTVLDMTPFIRKKKKKKVELREAGMKKSYLPGGIKKVIAKFFTKAF